MNKDKYILFALCIGIFFPLYDIDPKCEMIISQIYVLVSSCLLTYFFIIKRLFK